MQFSFPHSRFIAFWKMTQIFFYCSQRQKISMLQKTKQYELCYMQINNLKYLSHLIHAAQWKLTSSIFETDVRKSPDISQSNQTPNRGEEELPPTFPVSSFHFFVFLPRHFAPEQLHVRMANAHLPNGYVIYLLCMAELSLIGNVPDGFLNTRSTIWGGGVFVFYLFQWGFFGMQLNL